MNANTKPAFSGIFFIAVFCLAAMIGCTSKPAPVPVYMPERIILEYRDMQEHEIVSRAWIRRGFELAQCRTITREPVTDASQNPQPAVARRIEQGLDAILSGRARDNGRLDVQVRTNVLDMRPDRGRIRRWFADIDDFPYVEVEILINDRETGLPLVKLMHFSRDKKALSTAISDILTDLERFFSTSI